MTNLSLVIRLTPVKFYQQRWFQILMGGSLFFFITEQGLKTSGNPSFFPAVMLFGAFTVPAAFVAYIFGYERNVDRELHTKIPTGSVAECFFIGGIIGVTTAASIEFATLRTLGIPQLFGVGLIEESVKLIFPLIIFFRRPIYRTEADGLLFGIASGMGFAALETIGYGFATFSSSQGNVSAVVETLLVRGLFSPAGHAAWTGIVCAVLWRERNRIKDTRFTPAIIGAFILAIVLHASWDIVGSLDGLPIILTVLGFLVIAAIGVALLIKRIREGAPSRPTHTLASSIRLSKKGHSAA